MPCSGFQPSWEGRSHGIGQRSQNLNGHHDRRPFALQNNFLFRVSFRSHCKHGYAIIRPMKISTKAVSGIALSLLTLFAIFSWTGMDSDLNAYVTRYYATALAQFREGAERGDAT